jgi:hypothetical protein
MGESMSDVQALAFLLELATKARSPEDLDSVVQTAGLLANKLSEDQINEAIDQALDGIAASRKEKK